MYDPFLTREWGERHDAMSAGIDQAIGKLSLALRRRPKPRNDAPEQACPRAARS